MNTGLLSFPHGFLRAPTPPLLSRSGRVATARHVWNAIDSTGKVFTPEQFGAKGDGLTDDSAAFTKLAAAVTASAGGTIRFGQSRTYRTHDTVTGLQTVMAFTGVKGLTIDFRNSKIECNNAWVAGESLRIISLWDCENVDIISPHYEQLQNQTPLEAFDYGSRFIYLIDSTQHVRIWGLRQTGGTSGIEAVRSGSFSNANRAAHIYLFGGEFTNVFYPVNFQRNGDKFYADYRCRNVGRAYFPYNVSQHEVWIDSSHGGWPTSAVADLEISLFASSTGDDDNVTSDIEVHYKNLKKENANAAYSLAHVAMRQNDGSTAGGTIRNVRILLDLDNQGANAQPVIMRTAKFNSAGAVDNTVRGYTLENVFLGGVAKGWDNGVKIAQWFESGAGDWSGETVRNIGHRDFTSDGNTALDVDMAAVDNHFILENVYAPSHALSISNAAQDKLKPGLATVFSDLRTGEQTVTPTWGQTAGTGPTLGNGTLIARAIRHGNLITAVINMTMGSTTAFGDSGGDWTFALPAPFNQNAVRATVAQANALDASAALFYAGVARINTGANVIIVRAPGAGVGWKGNTPFTWANGDSLELTITYQVI